MNHGFSQIQGGEAGSLDLNGEIYSTMTLSVRPLTSALPVAMKLAILGCFETIMVSTTTTPMTTTTVAPSGKKH